MILDSTLFFGFRSAITSTSSTTTTTTTTTTFGCSAFFIRPWWSSASYTISTKPSSLRNKLQTAASASEFSSTDPPELNKKPSYYHPSEDIGESISPEFGDATLTPAEITRTLIEVNSKATLMFSGMIDDQVHDNIFWPDFPYLTDEHGNIYFEMKNNEDILQSLTSDNNYVQVIIGLDTTEMLEEIGLGNSDVDFGFEEVSEEDSDDEEDQEDDEEVDDDDDDDDDDDEQEWVGILEDELGSDGPWSKLETMRFSHPMSFARKLSEVVSDVPMDWMDQPSAGLAIQGLLQPAFIEEGSFMRRHITDHQSANGNTNQTEKIGEANSKDLDINGHDHKLGYRSSSEDSSLSEDVEKDGNQTTGSSFYKLELVKIQLVSPQGYQSAVELKDFRTARPDAIAHTAEKIISRLKAGGEKTAQALKSLCWRVKGIQVEEVVLIGVDSLGVDLRVCSGTQVQTLRFAFATRATSEYSAERQLHELMFPRSHKTQKRTETSPKEC